MKEWVTWLSGGEVSSESMSLQQIAMRAVVIYVIGVAIVRVGKSRLVGRVSAIDILVGFILGSLLSRGINGSASLSETAVAAATLVLAHWIVTWVAARWHFFGNLTKGHSVELVRDGNVFRENMQASHISDHDLAEACRLNGISNLEDVASAYKERNGDISVVKKR